MLQLTTIVFFIAFSTLAVIHILAVKLYLYWNVVWLDIPIHFLGGIVVALGLYTLRDLGLFPNKFLKLVPVIGLVFIVALIWEVWEIWAQLVDFSVMKDYYVDTTIDMVMGLCGGVVGYLVGKSLRNLR